MRTALAIALASLTAAACVPQNDDTHPVGLTGHVTEEMQRRYSTVGLDEKRAAIAGVIRWFHLRSATRAFATTQVDPTSPKR